MNGSKFGLRGLSVRSKLIGFSMVTSSIGLLLASSILIWVDQREASRLLVAEMARQAQIVGDNSTAALTFTDNTAAREILASLRADRRVAAACIYDDQKKVFATYHRDSGAKKQLPAVGDDGCRFLDRSLAVFLPIMLDDSRVGTVFIEADLTSLSARMWWFLEIVSSTCLGVGALVGVISSRIQRVISGPIVSLSKLAEAVTEREDFTMRAEKTSNDELGQLVDNFNAMLLRIQDRDANLILARNDALAATKAKSEFLANMSHEIRTPMTAILGFSEELRNENLPAADRQLAIDTISKNGHHLLEIINGILDLAKIEAGKITIEQVNCRPVKIMSEVMALMEVRSKANGLTLACALGNPVPEIIESDPTRLKQILVNLVGNAIKFTDRGGVQMVARLVFGHHEPELEFDVIDTGIGMTEAQISILFQAFTQADETMTRRFGGTGLGLAISQKLAKLLGGGISVHSKPGQGATFRLRIAARPSDATRMITTIDATRILNRRRAAPKASQRIECCLLLAEDGRDNQKLISLILAKAGAEVTLAENGRIAVEKALAAKSEGHSFDVILMDMQMPELDGYGATKELRESGWVGPIIAVTAHAMAEDRNKCIAAGCDDFATKPVNRRKLIDMIHRHLQ